MENLASHISNSMAYSGWIDMLQELCDMVNGLE